MTTLTLNKSGEERRTCNLLKLQIHEFAVEILKLVQRRDFPSAGFPNERFKSSGVPGLFFLSKDFTGGPLQSMQYLTQSQPKVGIKILLEEFRSFFSIGYMNAKMNGLVIDANEVIPIIEADNKSFGFSGPLPGHIDALAFPEYLQVFTEARDALEQLKTRLS